MGKDVSDIKNYESDFIWFATNEEVLSKDSKKNNKFVAIKNKEILASDTSLKKLISKLKKEKIDTNSVVIEFIPQKSHASMYNKK